MDFINKLIAFIDKLEKQQNYNILIYVKFYTDYSGVIMSEDIIKDQDPEYLYHFENLKELAEIIK